MEGNNLLILALAIKLHIVCMVFFIMLIKSSQPLLATVFFLLMFLTGSLVGYKWRELKE